MSEHDHTNEIADEITNETQDVTVYLEIGTRTASYMNVALSWAAAFALTVMARDHLLAFGLPFWAVALLLGVVLTGLWMLYRFHGDDE